jgi:hypothetical protein
VHVHALVAGAQVDKGFRVCTREPEPNPRLAQQFVVDAVECLGNVDE